MRSILIVSLLFAAAACTPPAETPPPEAAPAVEAPAEAPVEAEAGPYTNAWSSAEFSTFHHTLQAPSGGAHTLTLQAQTDSPGGETVAVYLAGPSGEPQTGWRMFVIATTRGETATESVDFPADGALPVVVVVENASNRTFSGTYTLSVAE